MHHRQHWLLLLTPIKFDRVPSTIEQCCATAQLHASTQLEQLLLDTGDGVALSLSFCAGDPSSFHVQYFQLAAVCSQECCLQLRYVLRLNLATARDAQAGQATDACQAQEPL